MSDSRELLYVAKKCEKVTADDLGKKKFQKLVYLIEMLGGVSLGYDYEIYYYGPYSRRLDDDLIRLAGEGSISYQHNGCAYLLRTTSVSDFVPVESRRQKIDEIVDRFGERKPADLELLTTTHFIAHLLGDGVGEKSIHDGVVKLKGSKFSSSRIDKAISELKLV